MITKRIQILAALIIAMGTANCLAYEEGDVIIRGGAATVDPNEDSGEIYSANGSYGSSGLDLYGGINSDTQLGINITYIFRSHWGIELLAATPFEHDISLESKTAGNVLPKAAETKHLPPTVSLQWYPMESNAKQQPYLGVGINYTVFFEEDLTTAFDCATNPSGCADTDLELDDSIGLALQAGIDWYLTDNVALNAAVWWIDISTDATIESPGADTSTTATTGPWDVGTSFDVDIDPWVYMVGIAYKF